MSPVSKKTVRHFVYDPLDRLIGVNATLHFYNQTRLAIEIEGERTSRLFEYDAQPLALQQDGATCALLTTNMQTSVLHSVNADGTQQADAYTPFGHQNDRQMLHSVSGFNGERPDPVTGHYLLGQGYRAFNPVLMRFNSPDNLSPFGEGGINVYGYCGGDPINKFDPTGHTFAWIKKILRPLKLMKRSRSFRTPVTPPHELIPSPSPQTNPLGGLVNPTTERPPAYSVGDNFNGPFFADLNSPPPRYIENPPPYPTQARNLPSTSTQLPATPPNYSQVNGVPMQNTNTSVLIASSTRRPSERLSREQISRNRQLLFKAHQNLRKAR